jgi:hypothetical protein
LGDSKLTLVIQKVVKKSIEISNILIVWIVPLKMIVRRDNIFGVSRHVNDFRANFFDAVWHQIEREMCLDESSCGLRFQTVVLGPKVFFIASSLTKR